MVDFPSFGLTLEEKSSLVVDVDALVAEAHDKLAMMPHPTDRDYEEVLQILKWAEIMARDCLEDDGEEEEEDDDDEDAEYVAGSFSPSAKKPRRRSLNQSLAEASVLRGDILRTQNKMAEARKAYNEAISRYPDAFLPPDAHAALTSASRRPFLIPRPASSPAVAAAKRSSVRRHRRPSPPPGAARRAWRSLMELNLSPSETNSPPSNSRTLSKRDKRRGGVWSGGIYEPGTPVAETTEAEVASLLRRHMETPSWDVSAQNVEARKQVSIVRGGDDSASDSSASSGAMSSRSIQYKKKCGDLRTMAQEPRRKR